jgi:hypothetical protein
VSTSVQVDEKGILKLDLPDGWQEEFDKDLRKDLPM